MRQLLPGTARKSSHCCELHNAMTRSRFPGRYRNPCCEKGHHFAIECPINILFHFQLNKNRSDVQSVDKKLVDIARRTKILEQRYTGRIAVTGIARAAPQTSSCPDRSMIGCAITERQLWTCPDCSIILLPIKYFRCALTCAAL